MVWDKTDIIYSFTGSLPKHANGIARLFPFLGRYKIEKLSNMVYT